MPDIAIVGGGIIGAACAYELSRAGASVTLIEREELAAGASGRNQGWFVLPEDPVLEPMARATLPTYLDVAASAPSPSGSTANRSVICSWRSRATTCRERRTP